MIFEAPSTEGVLSTIGLFRNFMVRIVIWGLTDIDNELIERKNFHKLRVYANFHIMQGWRFQISALNKILFSFEWEAYRRHEENESTSML